MNEIQQLTKHFDDRFDRFEHEQREDRKEYFDNIKELTKHNHTQDLQIQGNVAAIQAVDKRAGDVETDLDDTKDYWRRKFRFRWETLFKVLGWVFGSGGVITGLVFLAKAILGG